MHGANMEIRIGLKKSQRYEVINLCDEMVTEVQFYRRVPRYRLTPATAENPTAFRLRIVALISKHPVHNSVCMLFSLGSSVFLPELCD